jgi:GT2 family glycosyltransferase
VVVVDNRSTEPDVAFVRREFPEMEVVVAERNDYLFSLNPIVASRPEEVVVVLNNDMRVEPDFLLPLLEHFRDPSVFGVSAKVYDWDGREETTGQRLIDLRHFWLYKHWVRGREGPCYTIEGGGGCTAYRRRMFAELGGFDPLFRPGYYEDFDLAYRGWTRGWRTVYEPRSVIYHRVGATLQQSAREEAFRAHLARNHALFTAKSVGGWSFLAGFLALLPVRIMRSWAAGDRANAVGLLRAIPHLPRAIGARLGAIGRSALSAPAIVAALRQPVRTIRQPATSVQGSIS